MGLARNLSDFRPNANGVLVPNFNGIKFPASQVASANANTLDDYEEGTFTPALGYAGGNGSMSVSYGAQYGWYTKVGNTVFFRIDLRLASFSKGSASGTPIITGLPFASSNDGGYGAFSVIAAPYYWSYTTIPVASVAGSGATWVNLNQLQVNNVFSFMSDPNASSIMWVTGSYQVSN